MQEQVNDKTVTLVVKGTKLTGRLLAKAISKLLAEMQKKNGQRQSGRKIAGYQAAYGGRRYRFDRHEPDSVTCRSV